MDFLLITCILLNVSIGIIFKYFDIYKIDTMQAVVMNYFACCLTASVMMQDFSYIPKAFSKPWLPYAMAMGALFFTVFNAIAMTIKHHGVLITAAFQRLSLLAPVLVSLLFFHESLTLKLGFGIVTTIASILILNFDKKGLNQGLLVLPILVWLGSCAVDLSLFLVEKLKISEGENMEFTSILFLCAALFGSLVLIFQLLQGKRSLSVKSLGGGVLLGVPNFFSIYLILVLLANGWKGSVLFPSLNVSSILGSGLLGVILFKEKINAKQALGYGLAILSVILLS